jgi:type II secretory pathway pseudopilin PulG
MRSISPAAYTLVELLVALALSLILLLGITELLSRVGGTMNDTRSAMSMSVNLQEVALLLRQDLEKIPAALAKKPAAIASTNPILDEVSDHTGYLEITEGPDSALFYSEQDFKNGNFRGIFTTYGELPMLAPDEYALVLNDGNHNGETWRYENDGNIKATDKVFLYKNEKGLPDPSVGDVDDILAFTAIATAEEPPFRGLIPSDTGESQIQERGAAEIIWFVRGNSLCRRVRLIDDLRADDPNINTLADLARRERRFGHDNFQPKAFPYPLYRYGTSDPGIWYFLRMPTLEETLHGSWNPPNVGVLSTLEPHPDLWEQPYFYPDSQDRLSGSLKQFVSDPRHVRAGEDVILTNVLSFDVKVWCPIKGEFVDLGTPGTTWANSKNPGWVDKDGNELRLPRTWDSWSRSYSKDKNCSKYANDNGIVLPPYQESLEAIQITLRCFDPASRVIKQVTVVHRFEN